jgi:hypothetical protein
VLDKLQPRHVKCGLSRATKVRTDGHFANVKPCSTSLISTPIRICRICGIEFPGEGTARVEHPNKCHRRICYHHYSAVIDQPWFVYRTGKEEMKLMPYIRFPTAFNAFNSLGTVSILFSYTITGSCLIWRRLNGAPLPPRRWSLGRLGLPVNI